METKENKGKQRGKMKIYLHFNIESFSNSYLVVNENTLEALIIDPNKITTMLIDQIEHSQYKLKAVFVTHKHEHHTAGISTLKKIYDFDVYAADAEISGEKNVLSGDGKIEACGLEILYFSVPGHSSDSLVYKIGNEVFTGDVISAALMGESSCSYNYRRLSNGIRTKIFSMPDSSLIFPGHGPLTSVGAEKMFNVELGKKRNWEEEGGEQQEN